MLVYNLSCNYLIDVWESEKFNPLAPCFCESADSFSETPHGTIRNHIAAMMIAEN